MQKWRIQDLRRYAQRGNLFEVSDRRLRVPWITVLSGRAFSLLIIIIACFQFEAGRNCPTGEGVYSVKLEESKNLEHIIDKVIELRSNPVNTSPVSLYFPPFLFIRFVFLLITPPSSLGPLVSCLVYFARLLNHSSPPPQLP